MRPKVKLPNRGGGSADSVYLLHELESGVPTGFYKIGYTKGDVESRIKEYRAGNHRTVELHYRIKVAKGIGQAVESKIHATFPEARQKNRSAGDEWFKLDQKRLQDVLQFMSSFDADADNDIPDIAFDLSADPLSRSKIGTRSFSSRTIEFIATDLLSHRRLNLILAGETRRTKQVFFPID